MPFEITFQLDEQLKERMLILRYFYIIYSIYFIWLQLVFLMTKRFLFSIVLILFSGILKSQQKGPFNIVMGYGYYEALYVGCEYAGEKNNWLLGAGYNFGISNVHYSSYFFEFQHPLTHSSNNKFEMGWSGKLLFWRQVDDIFFWGNLGVMPNAYLNYKISSPLSLGFNMGPQFNFNLYNKRLDYLNSGWVKIIDINYALFLSYAL